MLRIGTSGYSYADWKGCFYPSTVKQGEMLSFYAAEFDTVEINYTFYRMPSAQSLAAMAREVPHEFKFTLKVNQAITHSGGAVPDNSDLASHCQEFCAALAPLQAQGQLGCLLAQFPNSFQCSDRHQDYLKRLREHMGDVPVVVEFRHRSWVQESVFHFLAEHNLGYCCVDSPGELAQEHSEFRGLLPAIALATTPIAYVRLHGRNTAKWWQHQHAYERYDYSYTEVELQEWQPKLQALKQQSQQVYVFTNNCYKCQAITAARQMKTLMGLTPKKPTTVQLELL